MIKRRDAECHVYWCMCPSLGVRVRLRWLTLSNLVQNKQALSLAVKCEK